MLTIFTSPKPFKMRHIDIIQRNAIKSWTLLDPKPQVIVFGEEEGDAEICKELDLTHVPKVATSERGTPLISSMFQTARELSPNPLLCYVNADIVLNNDLLGALRVAHATAPKFLMTGQRTSLDIVDLLDFGQPGWESQLRRLAATKGHMDPWLAMDYFAFPRDTYVDVPPFVVGRARWDNWMAYSIRKRGLPLIDATRDVLAIHQNHDYKHLAGGVKDCFVNPEGQRNQELYGLDTCVGTIDATHMLKNGRVRRALGRTSISRSLETLPIFHPTLAKFAAPVLWGRDLARGIRKKIGTEPAVQAPAGPWAQ
jgi:hypothetical protein